MNNRTKIIKKLDTFIRGVIRERDKGICQRCGSAPSAPQVSHYWSRRIIGTRWDPKNLCLLCSGCHLLWEHDKQGDYRDYMIRVLGQDKYDALEVKARTVTKWPTVDLELLYEFLTKK